MRERTKTDAEVAAVYERYGHYQQQLRQRLRHKALRPIKVRQQRPAKHGSHRKVEQGNLKNDGGYELPPLLVNLPTGDGPGARPL